MMTPQGLTQKQISELSQLLARYITEKRARYATCSIPLAPQQKAAFAGFFSTELLKDARLLVLTEERVTNPDFYPTLRTLGFNNLPDISMMAAITFSDTIVSHGPPAIETLFHELVHVEQYRQLGIPRFSALYVRGFLNGGGYDGIPLEENARALQARFGNNPGSRFSVTDAVADWIALGR